MNPLGFSLEFRDQTALVGVTDRRVTQALVIDRLELEVPDVTFPFDVSGGAEQFRHRRCRLRLLKLSIGQDDLARYLSGALAPERYGILLDDCSLGQGHGRLAGRFQVGGDQVAFSVRLRAEPGRGLALRVDAFDVRLFGWLPVPGSTVVAQLIRALSKLRIDQAGPSGLIFYPVHDLMRWMLPLHGWKIPELKGLRFDRITFRRGRLELTTARFPDELPAPPEPDPEQSVSEREGLVFREGTELFQEAELALLEGRLEEARSLYLGRGEIEPGHPLAAKRLLEIGLTRPDRAEESLDLIRDLLARQEDHVQALLTRAALLEKLGRQDAGAAYERAGEACEAQGQQADAVLARLRAGELLVEVDLDRAIANLERVLVLARDHEPAMRSLADAYERAGHWYRALRLHLRLARRLSLPAEIAERHTRMGRIYLERFDDLERARKHLDAALTNAPDHLSALMLQATVQQRRGRSTRAAQLLGRALEQVSAQDDPSLTLETRLRLARMWEEDLDDPGVALSHYTQILEEHPDHLDALFRAGRLAAELDRPDQAAEAFGRLLDLEEAGQALPDEVVKAAGMHLGQIYLQRPEGQSEARSFFARVTELDPRDPQAWKALEQIDRDREDWASLVDVLEHKAALADDSGQALDALLEAASLSQRRLDDPRRSEALFRQALEREPQSQEALVGLTERLEQGGRWAELEEILIGSIRQDLPADLAAERWYRVGMLRVEQMGDLAAGLEALGLAGRLDPQNGTIATALIGFYREHDRFEDFVALVPRLARDAFDAETWTDLWLQRARILAEGLDRRTEAIESYRKVLQVDPDQLAAQRALADLLYEDQEWESAREAVQRVIALAGEGGLSGPGGTELHRRLAKIELQLGDRQAAVEQYRIVLSRFDQDQEAATQIASLLRDDQRWEELAAFYARRAEQLEGEEAAALHTAAASIWWDKLGRLEPAASQYQAAVEAVPEGDAAVARLGSLQRLFAELGQWSDVAEVLRRRIAMSPAEQVPALYMALASILSSRLEDPQAAVACWQDSLAVEPEFRPALMALAEHAFEKGEHGQAFEYGSRALQAPRPTLVVDDEDHDAVRLEAELPAERRAALALMTARSAWAMSDHEGAARYYELHMEAFAERGYADVDPEALERLELVLREARRYEDLALLYRRWLKTDQMPDRHVGLRRGLALLLFEHLDQPDEAIQLLGEVVRAHPEDQPAVRDLVEMLRKGSRWEQLAKLLDAQWEFAPELDERVARLEELAELFQLRLHDPVGAVERYRQLLQLGHYPAAERLASIYRQEGMHAELVELLREQAEKESEPEQAASLWREIGRLCQEELDDVELAREAFERAFDGLPSEQNRDALLDLLREADEPARFEEFLVRSASEAEDPLDRRQLLIEHAELCLTRLDQRADGLSSLREALEIQPEESLARRAQALYEVDEDWEGVADMQEVLVDLADSETAVARRLHRLGQLYAQKLDAPERAAAAFTRAAELDPSWLEPNHSLSEILEQLGRHEELIEVKVRIAQAVTDRQERGQVLRQAAALAFDELGDHERGVELLGRAAELVADPAPIWLELASRLEQEGETAEAADALERLAEDSRHAHEVGDGAQTPAALYRRIAVLRQQAGDELSAIAAYERTLRQEPSDEESAQQLQALYREHGRFEDLAQMLTDLARRRPGREAADVWLAVAVAWEEAGDDESASAALQSALEVAPGAREVVCRMANWLERRKDWSGLLQWLPTLEPESLEQDEVAMAGLACFEGIVAQPKSAEQELEACRLMLQLDPVHLGALRRAARLAEEQGRADEAEELLRKLDAQADRLTVEQRYELDLRLANIDFARGRSAEAETRLKRCIEARPDDPGPRAFLHKLYEGGERFADRVALLLEESERAENQSDRFERLRSAAYILELEMGDPAGAAELFEQIVAAEPDRLEAWRKLADLYRLSEANDDQRRALLRVGELASGEERQRALRMAARIASDLLDAQQARSDLERLLEEVPGDQEALDRLLVLDRHEQDHESLEGHLGQRIAVTTDPVALAGLLRERADVLSGPMDRAEEAIVPLERLRELLPSDPETLTRLHELYLAFERWSEAVQILERRISLAGTERERAPLWEELASLRAERLDDAVGAVEAWRQAASLDPSRLAPLENLRALAVAQGDDALLAEALEALAARTADEADELKLLRSLGLLNYELDRADEARRTFTRVLALEPDDLVGRQFMARLLFDSNPRAALPHLEWLVGNADLIPPAELIEIHRKRVSALTDAEPTERIAALEDLLELSPDRQAAVELTELFREVGDRPALANMLERIGEMDADLGDPATWMERAELMLQEGHPQKAAEAMQRALKLEGDHRFEVAVSLAELQRDSLEDPAAALASFEVARGLQPEAIEVLDSLAELYLEREQFEEAADVLGKLLGQCKEEDIVDVALRLGGARREIGQLDLARGALEQALQADPACLPAYQQLEQLQDGVPDLKVGMFYLTWAGSPAAGSRRPALYLAAADHLEGAGEVDSAQRALTEALRLDPTDTRFHSRLATLLRDRHEHQALADLLEQWLKVESEGQVKAEVALELGELRRDRLADPETSMEAFEACLEADPENSTALLALADLRFERERWEQAGELYARLGDDVPQQRRASVAVRRGSLAAMGGQASEAIICFREALALDATLLRAHEGLVLALCDAEEVDAAIDAIDGLLASDVDPAEVDLTLDALEQRLSTGPVRAHLLGVIGDRGRGVVDRPQVWIERADLLQEQGYTAQAAESLERALALQGDHRLEVGLRLAKIQLDQLDDEDGALKSLEEVIEIDADQPEALARLSDLYWSREDWQAAGEVTERLLARADDEQAPGLALRLGDIRISQGRTEDGRTAFERALELDPAYRHAFERLEQLLAEEADPSVLAAFYLRWARGPAAGAGRWSLFRTAARQLERASKVDEAIEVLQEALAADPDNPDLFVVLAPLLGQEQRWEELLELLQHHRNLAEDDQRRLGLSFEIGQICFEQLADPDRAAIHFAACLEIDPDHAGALEQLAGIRYTQREFDAAADLYEHLGDRVSSVGRFLAAFRLGEIRESQGRESEALEHYTAAIAANPTFLPARENSARLLEQAGRWAEAGDALQGWLQALPDEGFEDVSLQLHRRLADAYRRQLRFDEAAEAYRRILAMKADDASALIALKDYHASRMEWEPMAQLLGRLVTLDDARGLRAIHLELLGDLMATRLGQPEKAIEAYAAAAELDPERRQGPLGWKLWPLLVLRGDAQAMCELGPDLLEAGGPPEKLIPLHLALGRAWLETGRDQATALNHFEAVLAEGRADLDFVEEVAEIARRVGRWALYASLAGQSIEQHLGQGLDPEVAMEGYVELARVYQEELKDVTRAASAIRRALELHPQDPELLRRLGHLYASNFDTYKEAIEVFRELLGRDPGDPESFRYLARLEAARGDMDRTSCYYAGLRFLAPADQEARRYLSYVGEPPRPSRPLNPQEWDQIFLHPGADCLLQRVVSALAPSLEQLFPPNINRFQLIGGRAGPGENPEAFRIAQQAAWLVGGRQVVILVARENVYRAWHESGPEPVLVLSSAVIERSAPAELTFFVTREAVRAAMGCVLPTKFSRPDLTQLLAILSLLTDVEAEPLVALPATATQYVEAIRRSTPQSLMTMVVPLLRQFALEPRAHDLDRWLAGVGRTADRVGLLACGDLNAALSVLTRFTPAAGGRELAFVPDRGTLLTSDDDLLALYRFAFSEPYFQIRKALGVAAGGTTAAP